MVGIHVPDVLSVLRTFNAIASCAVIPRGHVHGPAICNQNWIRACLFLSFDNRNLVPFLSPQPTEVAKVTLGHIRDVLSTKDSHFKPFDLAFILRRVNARILKIFKALEDDFVSRNMLGYFAPCFAMCNEFFGCYELADT
jgi:hypothetical protein